MSLKNSRFEKIKNEIAVCLNSDENQILFNNYFSQYIKDHPIERLYDSQILFQTSFENLKVKTFCLFLYHSEEGKNILNSIYGKYNGDDIVICKEIIGMESNNVKLGKLLEIKLNPDNIKSAIESFANSSESEFRSYFDYHFAHKFVESCLDLFDKILNDEQCKVDPIIINRCIRKFDIAETFVELRDKSILKIMEYTDLEKEIPLKDKSVHAIINNFKLLANNFEVPDLFIKFTFKFMDFEKLKQPQQETIAEKNARYDLIYGTINALVEPIYCAGADVHTWFDVFKGLLQNDIYNEFVDALNDIEDIGDILNFETMDKFNLKSAKKLKMQLKKENLKFVVENGEGENGNKKINVVVEENYIDQKQKLELVDKIKIPNTDEIKSINDGNKGANKWVLKIFFIPKKNKNKLILFGVDAVLFLIILSIFITPYFVAALFFLHSIFVLTLELICGLLSLSHGIILLKSIYFENENNGKINIRGKEDTLNLQSKIKYKQDIALKNSKIIKNLFK